MKKEKSLDLHQDVYVYVFNSFSSVLCSEALNTVMTLTRTEPSGGQYTIPKPVFILLESIAFPVEALT